VTKFVGKFRKNKDYKDDYNYAKDFLNVKKRRNEHSEVKKQLREKDWESHLFDEELRKD
jgi:hypothetical protein